MKPRVRALLFAACFGVAGSSLALEKPQPGEAGCQATIYLTLDTGSMRHAELIAGILRKYQVRATFFVAQEATDRGDFALDPAWGEFWRARVAEGHAFGSHTWRHGSFRRDLPDGWVAYRLQGGHEERLDAEGICTELRQPGERFQALTGRPLDALWRAPGGRTTPHTLAAATACGYRHVGWAAAGFLGDELPSERYPNTLLVERALRGIRDGDILMAHLGIRSRHDPFAPMLDPLIAGLKARGFCFAPLSHR